MSGVISAKWWTPRQRGEDSPGPMARSCRRVSEQEPKPEKWGFDMRRVVVTGANRGLGFEFVRQLLAAGDEVVAAVRQPKTADSLHKLVSASGGRGSVVRLDVADPASINAGALHIGERFAAVDLLINNAGVWAAPGQPERL